MKVSVIGAGYVGLTCACLANFGHNVILIGKSPDKASQINKGLSPIFEPGLDEVLRKNLDAGKLRATVDYSHVKDSDVVFLAVGTPSREDGSIDLSQIQTATESLADQLKQTDKFIVFVVKSTVVPGTTKNFVAPILEKISDKRVGVDFGIAMNPEFLREGTGVYDFLNPDKIVLGVSDARSEKVLRDLYSWVNEKIPMVVTDTSTAEMIKYAQNSMLATRISFMNEIANMCEKFGVDVYDVAHAMGLDTRIGPKFLNAGAGFGGSCFPKDVKALIAAAKSAGLSTKILDSVMDVNEDQPHRMLELAKHAVGDLSGKTIAVLGLAFKPDTDDMRESRSIPVVNSLVKQGAVVKTYDPQAMQNAKGIFGESIKYCGNTEECLQNADACLIMTEWDEFKNLNLSKIKCPVIDGRRAISPEKAKESGVHYRGIGWNGNFEAV